MPSSNGRSLLGWLSKAADQDDADIDELSTRNYHIYENERLLIGRDSKKCQIVVDNPSISNHHLKIYSITYDDEPRQIFIYAQDISTNGSCWIYNSGSHYEESSMGRGVAVLLDDGDRVKLCDGTCFRFSSEMAMQPVGKAPYADQVQQTEIDSFKNLYRLTNRQLGAGGYGRVLLAVDRFRSRQLACKIVSLMQHKQAGEDDFASKLWREVHLLKDISHPNVIHVHRVFYTDNNIYIIEDLIAGGDLRSYIDRMDETLADSDASMIVYQILKALEYLHGRGIAHRDLKPENVLMSLPAVDARIILADFGQSTKSSKTRMQSCVGTTDYVAPEVKGLNPHVSKSGYTMGADMWSVGALTTALFLGRSYFADPQELESRQNSEAAILEAASKCDLDALDHSPLWKDVSHQAKDFIKRLLVLKEPSRAKVKQALAHPWFTAGDGGKQFEERYQSIIKGWMPTQAAQDFQEDLKVFMNVRKEIINSQAMPPPPKPKAKTTQRRPLQVTLNEAHASPYFLAPAAKEFPSGYVNPIDKRPFSVLNEGKENLLRPTKRKPKAVGQAKTTRPYDDNAISCRGSNVSNNSELLSKSSKGSRTSNKHPIQEQIPTCSPEDNEVDLYLRVGEERKGFRSAKSFGRAVAERKNMKEL